MAGICGICELGAPIRRGEIEGMLAAMPFAGETSLTVSAGRSLGLGVASRSQNQAVATTADVRVCADADLVNLSELKTELGESRAALNVAEVIASLYAAHGLGFLERIHGAFAIALWDQEAERLLLASDRLGISPLYWTRHGNRLAFASRASAITAIGHFSLEHAALLQFLLFSAVTAPYSIYRDVYRLRPGYALIFEKGQERHRCYWDVAYVENFSHDVRRWAEKLRNHIRTAVHAHLADRRAADTGAFLSGGTDSSSVVAFMSERHTPVNTFSISFEDAGFNEIGFARTTAECFATSHHEKCITPEDAWHCIPKLIEHYDEPFANSSAIGAYYCALLAKQTGVDLLLAGDGGDEIFAGNQRYASDKRFALYHSIPNFIRRGLLEPLARLLPESDGFLSLPRRYIRRASIPNPRRILSYSLFLSMEPQQVFEPLFLEEVPPATWLDLAENHYYAPAAASELNRLLYLDVKITLADNDLRKVVHTAELAGVRVRFPLLDDRLVELSGQIPTSLKLKGFEKRFLFKEAMKPLLPRKVLYKKKHGFGVPLSYWFLQDKRLNSMMHDVLWDPRTRQRGYFRKDFLDRLLKLHGCDHAGYYGEVVWYLMVLELWHRHHLERVPEVPRAR